MAKGIWVSPTKYIELSETPSRAELTREIASRGAAWDYSGLIGLLPDPDPVLTKRGDGVEVLEGLTADGHLTSVIQTRKLGTLRREWRWTAGTLNDKNATPASTKLRDHLVEDLERVDLYNLISGILDAPYYGLTPIEIIWAPGEGRLRIKDIRCLPARWFAFNEQNQPRFKSMTSPWDGEELPFGKFVFARHFPTYDNPYGLRLLSRCFWPVTFKRGGLKFWVTFMEKYGMPCLVGKYRPGATTDEQETLLANLAKMVQDAVAVVPDGSGVELHGASGGKSTSSDLYDRFTSAMDSEISKVIMGQTLTAEVSKEGGSYAASKTHGEVLAEYQTADQKLVKTVMEEIAWLYGLVNAAGAATPTFSWFEEEDPQAGFAGRDKDLRATGVTFTKQYYIRRYGFADDEIEIQGQQGKEAGSAFAEGDPLAQDLGDIMAGKTASMVDPLLSAWVGKIRALANEAAGLEELRERLLDLYPQMDDAAVAGLLALGLAGADLGGRLDVSEDLHG